MDAGAPRLGVGMTPEEARNFVNQLNAQVLVPFGAHVAAPLL